MPGWTVEDPQEISFDDVREVRVRLVEGEVNVTATDGSTRLEVHKIEGEPLAVSLHDGLLEIGHADLTWGGLTTFVTHRRRHYAAISLSMPESAPLRLGVVSASAVVTGLTADTSVRSVSGDVTLDGITGDVEAESVSGSLEALAITGPVHFSTVSGALTLARARSQRVRVKSVSGDLSVDVVLEAGGQLRADAVSGAVHVSLADPVDATVEVSTVSGRLTSAYDGLREDRSPGRRTLRGRLGGGSGEIRVRTVSGDASLLSRSVE